MDASRSSTTARRLARATAARSAAMISSSADRSGPLPVEVYRRSDTSRPRHFVTPDDLGGRADARGTALPRVLSRREAIERGFSRHAIAHLVQRRYWHLVLPHTYLTGDTLTWTDRLDAALAFAGPDAVLTGAAALADLGLRSVSRPDTVLVLVPRSCRVRPIGWVRVRRTDRMPECATTSGPRRAEPARAVADLALEWRGLDDVRTLVSQAVRGRVCTLSELWSQYEDGPRRNSAALRTALTDLDRGAWSAPEARAAAILRRAGVPAFEQNARIDLPGGRYLIVDFLWRALRAVLEIDSDAHHRDPVDRDRTDERHLALETLGFTVAHRRPSMIISSPDRFGREIQAWLAARSENVSTRLP